MRRFFFPPSPLFRTWLSLWHPLLMLAIIPSLSNWLGNSHQISISDLGLPLLLDTLTACTVGLVFFRLYQRDRLAGFFSAFLTVMIINHAFGESYQDIRPVLYALNPLPNLNAYEDLWLWFVYLIISGCLALFLGRKLAAAASRIKIPNQDWQSTLSLVTSVTFLLLLLQVIWTATAEWKQFSYRPAPLPSAGNQPTVKPDIYYLVPDRYTNQEILQDQFKFDNQAFLTSLTTLGLTVNNSAHSAYPYTAMSIASTLRGDYHSDLSTKFASAKKQSLQPYHEIVHFSPVIQQLKAAGYTYHHFGSWYESTNHAPLAEHLYQKEARLILFNRVFILNTFPKSRLTDGPWWQPIKKGVRIGSYKILAYEDISEADATEFKLATLKRLARQPAGGRFIMAHLLIPHDPYYFNADGSRSLNSGSNNDGKPIKKKYLGQVEYLNRELLDLISIIQTSSQHEAVIILQSDEGPYPMQLLDEDFDGYQVNQEISEGDMRNWSDDALRMKFGVLAAYQVPAASSTEMEKAADPVNIFRLVLNTYLGHSLPYLPRCQYGFKNGRQQSFAYTNLTERITGKENPACPENGQF